MARNGDVPSTLGVFLFLAIGLPLAFSWSPVAHMVIAELALMQLTPQARIQTEFYLKTFDQVHKRQDFVTASVWPTEIKLANNRLFDTWHYVNLPIANGEAVPPTSIGKDDIVWAIGKCLELLHANSTDASGWQLATHLLIHLVGDIHQPLHCASRRTDYNGLEGDRGASALTVAQSPARDSPSLHKFWDNGAGIFDDVEVMAGTPPGPLLIANRGHISDAAQELHRSFQASGDITETEINQMNVTAWALHGRDLAIMSVYGGSVMSSIDDMDPGWPVKLDDEYVEYAKNVSKRQVAVAGYRLGKIFNDIYHSQPDDQTYRLYWDNNGSKKDSNGWIIALSVLLALAIIAFGTTLMVLLAERERAEEGKYNNLRGGNSMSLTGEELGGGRMLANSSMDDIYGRSEE